MRRTIIATLALAMTLWFVPAASASQHRLDRPLRLGEEARERLVAWALGSSTNPLLQPSFCGERRGSRFFLNAAISPGTQTAHCEIPAGMPIILSPGGGFAWAPTDGETDAELLAAAEFFFSAVSDPRVVLDGRRLSVGEPYVSDVIDVRLHPGNFMQLADPATEGLPSTRVAFIGYFAKVALSEGDHVLIIRDTITPPGEDPLPNFRYKFFIEAE